MNLPIKKIKSVHLKRPLELLYTFQRLTFLLIIILQVIQLNSVFKWSYINTSVLFSLSVK